MAYNYKYKMEWVGLKQANGNAYYYRLEFYRKEETEIQYNVIPLTASNTPFILNYNAKSDFVFEPFRYSSAEINFFLKGGSTVIPEDFFQDIDNKSYKVILKLIDVANNTETSLWSGFLLNDDIEYEYQYDTYLRLTATDNLAILKEYKYSEDNKFSMYTSQDVYTGISIKDFVIRCLNYIGLDLDVKFAFNLYEEEEIRNETNMYISEYACIDWSKKYPYDIEYLLSSLLKSLGLILYQDNRDNTWVILNINEIGTSVNNTVTYRKYDYLGNYIESSNYDISGKINTNIDDFKFSDTNQIVTLRKRYDGVKLKYPFIRKNICQNYSFFKETAGVPDNWSLISTIDAEVKDILYNYPYDSNVLNISAEDNDANPVDGTMYAEMSFDFSRYKVSQNTNFSPVQFLIKFDYQFLNADPIDGFNVSFYATRPATGDLITFDENGNWSLNSISDKTRNNPVRIPVFNGNQLTSLSTITKWNSFRVLSKGIYNANFPELEIVDLLFRPLRTSSVSGIKSYNIDNVVVNLNIFASDLFLKNISYISSQRYTISEISPSYQTNTKIIESKFHIRDEYSAIIEEDCIWTLYNDGINDYIQTTNNWTRKWETHTENNYKFLNCLTTSSILSFYRNVGHIIDGNVYAEQTPIIAKPFAFPMYLGVGSINNKQASIDVENTFETYVLNDLGTIETTTCDEDFVYEFNRPLSNFFMHEASFDYYTNKTNCNLQEDFTSTDETNFFADLGESERLDNSNMGTIGSNTGDTQVDITGG